MQKDKLKTVSPTIGNTMLAVRSLSVKDLRVGNYLQKDGVMVQIDARSLFDIWEETKEYVPIELSRDIMFRLGFEVFPWGWVKVSNNDFGVRLTLQSFSYEVSGNNAVRLKFVHQLQNLFYCLTGEDLVFPKMAANGSSYV